MGHCSWSTVDSELIGDLGFVCFIRWQLASDEQGSQGVELNVSFSALPRLRDQRCRGRGSLRKSMPTLPRTCWIWSLRGKDHFDTTTYVGLGNALSACVFSLQEMSLLQ